MKWVTRQNDEKTSSTNVDISCFNNDTTMISVNN